MSTNEKSIVLTPSWKAFFWQYFFGVLLAPLLIGFYLLWKASKKKSSITYKITDHRITVVDGHISQNIDLVDIKQARAGELTFGVGNVTLKTSGREIELIGLQNPQLISTSIEKAIEAELKRLEAEKQTKPRETKYSPGSMEQLEYLTGLWQQGLIDDEEFKAQKQKLD
jgi:hypothetical protein